MARDIPILTVHACTQKKDITSQKILIKKVMTFPTFDMSNKVPFPRVYKSGL